ncbi:MAG: prolyl-tRNA synthetase associated domain-containing protein [Rhodospirillaceae bacterium]
MTTTEQSPGDKPELPTSPEALLDRLLQLGIKAVTVRHPPVHTVEESKAMRGDLPGCHCKTLLLKDKKGGLWLVVAGEDTSVDLKTLHLRLGSGRLSFAGAEVLWRVLGVRPGSVTPFALVNDTEGRVTVVLDAVMMACDLVNYHPLENDRTTALSPGDLLNFIKACGHVPSVIGLRADGA